MKLYKIEAQSTKCTYGYDIGPTKGFGSREAAERFLIGLAQSGQARSGEIYSYEDEDEDEDED
jgi:hypothetical protein